MVKTSGENRPVLVIDFGGQYGHLIARRFRELGYRVTHLPAKTVKGAGVREVTAEVAGVVLSGGPASVWESMHDDIVRAVLNTGIPMLGICYGHQLLAKMLGGRVSKAPKPEFGPTEVRILRPEDPIFKGFHSDRILVWMSHNDAVITPPPGAEVLAVSEGSPVAAMRVGDRIYGVQWHPEVSHSQYGSRLLMNWAEISGIPRGWGESEILNLAVQTLKEQIAGLEGGARVISAVSGGVDSTVATVLAEKYSELDIIPVLLEHGLHPAGWVEDTVDALRSLGIEVVVVDVSDRFLDALKGLTDPEVKRKVISRLYFDELHRIAKEYNAKGLIQGTIYPDVIESGGLPGADRIKTHHNIGHREAAHGLIIIEPLRWLYKDEVRRLGRMLGIPDSILNRQPVPGPGLAVRIEGEVTREKVEVVRRADAIVREVIRNHKLEEGLWQYFAILTGSRATGVKGDRREYGYVIAVRAVESSEAMTARAARLPWEVLEEIMVRITREVPGVTRVLYDLTSKPPATIEWE
ncbi:MAG: glutamine-hydrolyzing GMP synthase [Desulfurococcales archaeon]|nr:glutamine-hydrolyzing GMP synthase [Desulfurococcales archaeon]